MITDEEELRQRQREKYLRAFKAMQPVFHAAQTKTPAVPGEHPDLAGLDEVKETLRILSTTGQEAPASEAAPPDRDECDLQELKTRLMNLISSNTDVTQALSSRPPEETRAALRKQFETQFHKTRAAEARPITLTARQQDELLDGLVDEVLGCGPIEPLLRDEEISEIMVNGPRTVYVERAGKLFRSDRRFFDDAHLMNIITRIVSRIGRNLDLSNPHVDARLPDGSRVHAIIPPLAVDGPILTIRKFRAKMLQMEDLLGYDALTPEMAYFLGACVKARLNLVVSGGTGTGKTTLLNVLSTLVPPTQRIVTIEDAVELKVRESHPHVVRLEVRPMNIAGRGAIMIRDLVRDALRMRPDRLIVGECRGGEAMDMLQAMNTGHDGSMTTAHANSAADCLRRLESMCLMAGLELPAVAIRTQIASAIDLIVHMRRYADGSRRIAEIHELTGMEEGEIRTRPLFWYEVKGLSPEERVEGDFRIADQPPGFIAKFEAEGVTFPGEIFGEGSN